MANKHMKMFLSAVIIKEMQIKNTKTCQVASTRMATMKNKKINTVKDDNKSVSGYSDADKISDYATDALDWAVSFGVIEGTQENLILPKASATRAEVSTVLMRFCEDVLK